MNPNKSRNARRLGCRRRAYPPMSSSITTSKPSFAIITSFAARAHQPSSSSSPSSAPVPTNGDESGGESASTLRQRAPSASAALHARASGVAASARKTAAAQSAALAAGEV